MELPNGSDWECVRGHEDFLNLYFSIRSIMIGGFEDGTTFKHRKTKVIIQIVNGKPTIGGERFYYQKFRAALTGEVSAAHVQN